MPPLVPGRPPKYYFLIDRIADHQLYSAATIARLLGDEDLRTHPQLTGSLGQMRFRARQSLARVARQFRIKPCGFVFLGPNQTGNAYPAFRGLIWKAMFHLPGYTAYLTEPRAKPR